MTLVCGLCAYIAGIVAAAGMNFSWPLAAAPAFALPFFLIRVTRRFAFPLLCFTLGLSLYHLELREPSDLSHVVYRTGAMRILRGTVTRVFPASDRFFFDMEAEAEMEAQGKRCPVHGRVRVYVDTQRQDALPNIPSISLVPGDQVQLRARLRRPELFGTPGEFHRVRHLALQNIRALAYLADPQALVRISAVPSTARKLSFNMRVEHLRHSISAFIAQHVPSPESAACLRALLVGDASGISSALRETFAQLGIAHLFAISGLHMGILFTVLYFLGAFLWLRHEVPALCWGPPRRFLPVLLMPALGGYLLLAGSGLPARRAFVMAGLAALLALFRRQTSPFSLLAAAAFAILLMAPAALFSASFQLSFVAVAALLRWGPLCAQYFGSLSTPTRHIATLFTASACATAATFPITAFHFQNATLLGLLVNLFATPLIAGLALPIALAALPFAAWWPSLASLLLNIAAFLLEQTLACGRLLHDALPMLGGRCALLPHEVLGLALALAVLLCPWKKRISAALLILALGLAAFPAKRGSALPIVTALSVGQGDATLLSLADGHYLVDGGGLRSPTFDTGERLVAPALTRLGIRRLRAVILTHNHPDHYLGLIYILRHMRVDAFWAASEDLPEPFPEILRQRGIPLRTFAPGWNALPSESDATFAIFVPDQQTPKVNDRSLALLFGKRNINVLLTGDQEDAGVRALLNASPGLEAALLKLPHHGSASSAPDLLLNTLKPRQLFVSAGRSNRHHLPHPQTLREAARRKLPLARTDLEGTVRFLWTPRGWQKQRWQNGLFR